MTNIPFWWYCLLVACIAGVYLCGKYAVSTTDFSRGKWKGRK